MVQVIEYEDGRGRNRFRAWFDGLPATYAVKVATAVDRLAAGATSGLKGIGHGLAEWRIDCGPGLRLYLHQDGPRLLVLFGGSDKGDQSSEIKTAQALLDEYQARKKAGKPGRK